MTHFVPNNLPDRIRHYIDGEFVDSVDGSTFDVLDPVSNENYVQAAAGKQTDIDLARVRDPDNPTLTWDVHDNQRRDWWGTPVVPSWYAEGSTVLGLGGAPKSLVARVDAQEAAVTIGADGFSYTREGEAMPEYKLGNQL